MNAAIFQAANPVPFRILGLHLKPLSLGRYQLLKRHNIAFVAEETARAGVEDLILGVVICSQQVSEFRAWMELSQRERDKDLRQWGNRLTGWRAKFRGEVPDLIVSLQQFNAYVREHSRIPEYWNESENDQTPTGHWSDQIEVILRSEVGWSAEEIDEQPLSKAFAHYFKWAENQGLIRMMTEDEIAQGEQNARILAQATNN